MYSDLRYFDKNTRLASYLPVVMMPRLLFLKGNRMDIVCCVKIQGEEVKKDSFLFLFFKKIYAPFILNDWVRPIVVSNLQSCLLLRIKGNHW